MLFDAETVQRLRYLTFHNFGYAANPAKQFAEGDEVLVFPAKLLPKNLENGGGDELEARFQRNSTSTEKPNKNPGWSKHMSFLKVEEFLDFIDDLM